MATRVQGAFLSLSNGVTSGDQLISFSAPVGTGNSVLVYIQYFAGQGSGFQINSVNDDKGNIYAYGGTTFNNTLALSLAGVYSLLTTNNPQTIDVNVQIGSVAGSIFLVIEEWSGLVSFDNGIAVYQTAYNHNANNITSGNITLAGNDLLWSVSGTDAGNPVFSPGTGFTLGSSYATSNPTYSEFQAGVGSGGHAATWTAAANGSDAYTVAMAFKQPQPAAPWGFAEPYPPLPKRRRYFHQTQQDDVSGFPFPPIAKTANASWGFDEPPSIQPKRRKYFHPAQQDDISGFPFTTTRTLNTNWGFDEPYPLPPKRRRPFVQPKLIDDTSGFVFVPFNLGTPLNEVWDPSHSNPTLTIGNGGLSIGDPDLSPTNYYPAFAKVGTFSGKRYWETVGIYTQSQNNCGTGIGGTTSINTLSTKLGNCADEIAYYPQGQVVSGSVTIATIASAPSGTRVRHALDVDNALYWIDPGTGVWNGSPSANPATGAGGFALPVDLQIIPIVPAVNLAGGGTFYGFFRSAAWVNQPPAGFQSYDVEWGFDEPAAPPPKRLPLRRFEMPVDDISGFPFTTFVPASIWGFEDERSVRPKKLRYFHPVQPDDTAGFPFTAVGASTVPIWGDDFPPRVQRRPFFRSVQQDDVSGFPFNLVATPANWGDIDPPPKRQLRPLFKQIAQQDDTSGFPLTPTILVSWGFDEPYPLGPKRRVFFRSVQQDDISGLPFPTAPNPLTWQDIEQWVPPHRRMFFRCVQQDDISGLPFTAVLFTGPWGFEEQGPAPKRWRFFRSVQQDDVSGFVFTAVATPTKWGDIDPPPKRQLRMPFKQQIARSDEISGMIFTAVLTPSNWGDIEQQLPPQRRPRRTQRVRPEVEVEWLLFPPPRASFAPPPIPPDFNFLMNQLVSQYDAGYLTQTQFFMQRYALQWAWSGLASWDSLGLQLGMKVKSTVIPIYAPDGTVPLLPAPYNTIRNYPVVDARTLIASAQALLSLGKGLSVFTAPPPPAWAFRYYGVR